MKISLGKAWSFRLKDQKPLAPEKTPIPFGAQILNLTDLLQRSLRSNTVLDTSPDIESQKGKPKQKALPAKKLLAPDSHDDGTPHTPIKRRAA